MVDSIRTFIAIAVPISPLRGVLNDFAEIGRPVRVASEPLHLTLKFLGETGRDTVPAIYNALAEVALRHAPFEFLLAGIDAFPRRQRPSVIWVGADPEEPIRQLAADLESNLASLGLEREQRDFRAHTTIARVNGRPPRELDAVIELYRKEAFGVIAVNDIILYQSELSSTGPVYSVLATATLGGDPVSA